MAANLINLRNAPETRRNFLAGLLLMVGVLAISAFLLVLNSDFSKSFPYFFLLPWIFLLALVLSVPSLVLYRRGKFSLANPLIFATWSYFFPAFVVGGIMLAVGWSQPYFLSYIQDAETNLPLTICLIILGYAGLSIGYFLPIGAAIGKFIGDLFEVSEIKPTSTYLIPGLTLFALGLINSIVALAIGVIGYSANEEFNSYDGLVFLSTIFWLQSTFLLWSIVFRERKLSPHMYAVIGLLLSACLIEAVFAGNRSSLTHSLVMALLAFILAGRKLTIRQSIFAGILLFAFLLFGMIYGTTFRTIRGDESRGDLGKYTDNVLETVDTVSTNESVEAFQFGVSHLAERLDTVSSLAVVVSNYEQLAPYEESYGLDNNISSDLITMFVPRFVWNDKPVSDPRKYGALYFDTGDNSFAMTPMGDLLRNYGIASILFGMILAGILIRSIFAALIENRPLSILRATLYYLLLTTISYEGFYSTIFAPTLKVGLTAVVGTILVSFLARRIKSSSNKAMGA